MYMIFNRVIDRSGHTDKTRQVGQVNEQSTITRKAGWVNEPTLIANIVCAATNRTNIHNKAGGKHHYSVYLMSCLCIENLTRPPWDYLSICVTCPW